MTYYCPVCNSTAVDPAGGTDLYLSLICRDCQSWSTIPVARERAEPPPPPRPARRP